MIKLDDFELYKALYSAIKQDYTGNLYLCIEDITFLDSEDPQLTVSFDTYIVKGRYGRSGDNQFERSFELWCYTKQSFEEIKGAFREHIFNQESNEVMPNESED